MPGITIQNLRYRNNKTRSRSGLQDALIMVKIPQDDVVTSYNLSYDPVKDLGAQSSILGSDNGLLGSRVFNPPGIYVLRKV